MYTPPGSTRPAPAPWFPLWMTVFSSALSAVLVGGLILGLCVREYVNYRLDRLQERIESKARSLVAPGK